jgi:hypothetical protein
VARAKRPASADAARLKVLSAGDEAPFLAHALELLESTQRLDREAALEALLARPLPGARPALRRLFITLNADGLKRDQGATMRAAIVRILRALGDRRDRDIALAAVDAREVVLGDDIAWQLRAHGLMMLAELDPDAFPYYAAEHLDDVAGPEGEPANTAFQLLAATGQFALIYRWLLTTPRDSYQLPGVFEIFAAAPPEIVLRFVREAVEDAVARGDEPLCIVLAEAVVRLELEGAYSSLAAVLAAKVSDDLYRYVCVLLAGTNRPPLIAMLEEQLFRGRRPAIVADALNVRATPEQQAILQRWRSRDDDDDDGGG